MAIDTVEDAYHDYCKRMPAIAADARQVAGSGGIHQIIITTRDTGKRGLVTEMEEVRMVVSKKHGRFIDLT